MPMHVSHLQSEDNHHDASSASPAVNDNHDYASSASMVFPATLEMSSVERDADDYDEDDDEIDAESEDQHHDAS